MSYESIITLTDHPQKLDGYHLVPQKLGGYQEEWILGSYCSLRADDKSFCTVLLHFHIHLMSCLVGTQRIVALRAL